MSLSGPGATLESRSPMGRFRVRGDELAGSGHRPSSHSPWRRPLVIFLFIAQGSFPCSNKATKSGLEAQSPGSIRQTRKKERKPGCCRAGSLDLECSPLSSTQEGAAGMGINGRLHYHRHGQEEGRGRSGLPHPGMPGSCSCPASPSSTDSSAQS